MKSFKQSTLLFTVILIIISSSCKKDMEINQSLTLSTDNAALTASLFKCNGCPITYTTDNSFIGGGDDETVYFFYNKAGNPDSLNFSETPIKIQYDNFNRLKRADFGTPSYSFLTFNYNGNYPLPITMQEFYPNFGGLVTTDSFTYNREGQITSVVQMSPGYTAFNSIEKYTYNLQGNVVRVDLAPYNGGTINSFTEFTATKYDNKPNFFSGNQWTKYLMFFTTYQSSPYLWTQFSKNNAKDFNWVLDPAGDALSVISTFVYNREGFANTINEEFYDNVGDTLNYTRTSLSACDAAVPNIQARAAVNPLLFKNMHRKVQSPVPLLNHKY